MHFSSNNIHPLRQPQFGAIATNIESSSRFVTDPIKTKQDAEQMGRIYELMHQCPDNWAKLSISGDAPLRIELTSGEKNPNMFRVEKKFNSRNTYWIAWLKDQLASIVEKGRPPLF